jgi:hypothetical protein
MVGPTAIEDTSDKDVRAPKYAVHHRLSLANRQNSGSVAGT